MSFESHSELPKGTPLTRVKEIIDLLGYTKIANSLKIPDMKGNYFWTDEVDYKSWSGIGLQLYQDNKRIVTIDTRTSVARSEWDLIHQNKTIKLIRDTFGGEFWTDAGKSRYWRPDGNPPSPVSSGCYLARWHFHNVMIKPRLYLMQRGLDQPNTELAPRGLEILDEMNPRLFSNNLLLPYFVAVWEEYLRSSFIALLRYSKDRQAALKRASLNQRQLEAIATGANTVEEALADTLSFQRPSVVSKNFRLISNQWNIGAVWRKPYRRRKISLYDSIESYVEYRNEFVHSGQMNIRVTDKMVDRILKDFEAAADRAYAAFGKFANFDPIKDY